MKFIKLTRGKVAIIDEEDFEYLSQWKWWYTTRGYAVREDKGKVIFMHRVINDTPKGFDTDHINRDRLDNRRTNLRTATRSQNQWNRMLEQDNTSGCKGVDWFPGTPGRRYGRWVARIKVNYKSIHLGRFKDKEDAIAARKKAEAIYHVI